MTATTSPDLLSAIGGLHMADDQAICPYRLQNGAEGRYGPNTCIAGCWDEPTCVTMEPEGGWEQARIEALAEVAYVARLDAADARGHHGAVKHARDVARWAEKRIPR